MPALPVAALRAYAPGSADVKVGVQQVGVFPGSAVEATGQADSTPRNPRPTDQTRFAGGPGMVKPGAGPPREPVPDPLDSGVRPIPW